VESQMSAQLSMADFLPMQEKCHERLQAAQRAK
jgi:hypothetical protein